MKIILSFICVMLLAGCGTRKSEKSREEVKATVRDTNVVKLSTSSIEVKAKTLTHQEHGNFVWNSEHATLSPAEAGKPMTITDGTGKTATFTNAVVTIGKASGSGTIDKKEILQESASRKDTAAVAAVSGHAESLEKVSEVKATDRKGNPLGVGLGAGLATCIVLAFLWFVLFKNNED